MFAGIALGIVYAVWGSNYLAIRMMVEGIPSLTSARLRFLTVASSWPRRLRRTEYEEGERD